MGRNLEDATNALRMRRTRGVIFLLRFLLADFEGRLPAVRELLDVFLLEGFCLEDGEWAALGTADESSSVPARQRIGNRNNRRKFTTTQYFSA
jgi:hypothetical protein